MRTRLTPLRDVKDRGGLVEAQAGEVVTCRDVNSELHPEYPIGYSCFNEGGEFYAAVLSPDGVLTSLNGPVRLKPAGS